MLEPATQSRTAKFRMRIPFRRADLVDGVCVLGGTTLLLFAATAEKEFLIRISSRFPDLAFLALATVPALIGAARLKLSQTRQRSENGLQYLIATAFLAILIWYAALLLPRGYFTAISPIWTGSPAAIAAQAAILLAVVSVLRYMHENKESLGTAAPDTCAECGYSLFGITSRRCPECGRLIDSNGQGVFRINPRRYPELKLFETTEERNAAWQKVCRRRKHVRAALLWLPWMGILVFCLPTIGQLIGIAAPLGIILCAISVIVGQWRRYHITRRLVRLALNETGIPVCLHCGRDLRDEWAEGCPKCLRAQSDPIHPEQERVGNP